MKPIITLCLVLLTTGCGTVTTLSHSDEALSRKLVKRDTYCDSLPRVYSGVSYDLCVLNSKPTGTEWDVLVGFYVIDGAFSFLSDTVVLPYTIYRQATDGSVPIDG